MRWLVLLLLCGCAVVPPDPTPPGYRCDVTGACWPADFEHPTHHRERVYSPEVVEQICHTQHPEDPDLADHPWWRVYACTIARDSPSPIVILPDVPPPCMTTEDLREHELGHVAGVTVHNMIERNRVCHTTALQS